MRKGRNLPTADEFFRVGPAQGTEPETPTDEGAAHLGAETPPAQPSRTKDADGEEATDPSSASTRRRLRSPKRTPAKPSRPAPSSAADSLPMPDATVGPLEKVTLYLPNGMVKALELVRVRILMEHDIKVTRSDIAQIVLAKAIAEAAELQDMIVAEHSLPPSGD